MTGLALPAHMANGPQPQRPNITVAQPLNDVQVMVLVAAQFPIEMAIPDAIDRAAALFAEALAIQMTTPLGDLVEAAKRRRTLANSVKAGAK